VISSKNLKNESGLLMAVKYYEDDVYNVLMSRGYVGCKETRSAGNCLVYSKRIPSRMPFLTKDSESGHESGHTSQGKLKETAVYSSLKKQLFEDSKHRNIFLKKMICILEKASDINDLVPGYESYFPIFCQCFGGFTSDSEIEAAIEFTNIFIRHNYDFNKKGSGSRYDMTSLHFLIHYFSLCPWERNPDSLVEILRLILEEGNADPVVKDAKNRDALEIALHLKVPNELITIIRKTLSKENQDDCDDPLYKCKDWFTKDLFDVFLKVQSSSQTLELPRNIPLLPTPVEANNSRPTSSPRPSTSSSENDKVSNSPSKMPFKEDNNSEIKVSNKILETKEPIASLFQDFAKKYRMEFKSVEPVLGGAMDVDAKIDGTPIYVCFVKIILSSGGQLGSIIPMTKSFIKLIVDVNQRNNSNINCHCSINSMRCYFANNIKRRTLYSIVKLLIDSGADVTLQDKDGNDDLKHALKNRFSIEIIEFIFNSAKNKKSLLSVNKNEEDALQIARIYCDHAYSVVKNRLDEVSLTINGKTTDLNPKTNNTVEPSETKESAGQTCLKSVSLDFQDFATKYSKEFKAIESALSASEEINAKINGTPIYLFCIQTILSSGGQLESAMPLTKRFIELGVDFNRRDASNTTCLCALISLRKLFLNGLKSLNSTVILLIDNGADVTLEDKDGNDALKHALKNVLRKEILVKIVKSAGKDKRKILTSLNSNGENALKVASRVGGIGVGVINFFQTSLNEVNPTTQAVKTTKRQTIQQTTPQELKMETKSNEKKIDPKPFEVPLDFRSFSISFPDEYNLNILD